VVIAGRRGLPSRLVTRLPLGCDQLVEPADFPLDRLKSVPLQLERVAVQALSGPRQRRAEGIQPLFEPGPAALQDAQPDVRAGLAEEGEPDAEAVVLPRGRARLGQELLQPLLALRGQPVDDLRPAAGQGAARHAGFLLGDQALGQEVLEAGVERAVPERAERAEEGIQPLAQFIAVHGSLVQQAEHGQLEHSRPVTTAHDSPMPPDMPARPVPAGRAWRRYTSHRCIEPIHRQDMSNREMLQPPVRWPFAAAVHSPCPGPPARADGGPCGLGAVTNASYAVWDGTQEMCGRLRACPEGQGRLRGWRSPPPWGR